MDSLTEITPVTKLDYTSLDGALRLVYELALENALDEDDFDDGNDTLRQHYEEQQEALQLINDYFIGSGVLNNMSGVLQATDDMAYTLKLLSEAGNLESARHLARSGYARYQRYIANKL